MQSIYLTPASIGYLTQFILSATISVYLFRQRHHRTRQLLLLLIFFCAVTCFIGLLFLDAILLPFPRLLAVYAQNTVLGFALAFLIQFAYQFPKSYPKYGIVAKVSLVISVVYILFEAIYMIYRYSSLLIDGTVYYRPKILDICMAIVLILAPIAFCLQCVAADSRKVCWSKKVFNPQGKNALGARMFIFNFGILFYLGLINLLRSYQFFSTEFYNASLSIGILFALWMFTSNYINFIPGGVSVQVKIIALSLTLFLAILGTIGWAISTPYIQTYIPNLIDHQTIRFTPNGAGGYDISEVSFSFENTIGERVNVEANDINRNYAFDYDFPFYEKSYNRIYAASSGVITFGEPFWQPNMQTRYNHLPAIFPLMMDLNPQFGGGLYIWEDPITGRLVLTWYQIPAHYNRSSTFTFQTILYPDGIFEITYNGLPLPLIFAVDETPSANPWMRGITPGDGENLHTSTIQLLDSGSHSQKMAIENFQMDFRKYLHQFMLPFLWVVLGGILLMMIAFPRLLKSSVAIPLESLLAGIHKIEKGDMDLFIPVRNEDEIGLVTQHFNTMTTRINDLVLDLEKRVADRTRELSSANLNLHKRLDEINLLQTELKEQSIRDPLTNAFNRRFMMEILDMELARLNREKSSLSIIMIDVDYFKDFNDRYGHQAGDLILKRLVELIDAHIRKEDSICRFGGEEFMIILPKASQKDARKRAEELRQACEEMVIDFDTRKLSITISLGVVENSDPEINSDEMLKMADKALYLAKDTGRNCVSLYPHPKDKDQRSFSF